MQIVEWRPPRRCVVRHLGRIVQGEGVFEVFPAVAKQRLAGRSSRA
jgi:hypothetical protein